ncbi:MAG TPA: tRNA 4-thiouridine(8) synthase ThiI [bacterium]|nr:tRNA 4-thiouridine(8) synthase ThiI [bacterium]
MKEEITAIGLLSGGLDSSLAVSLMQEQGIRVIGLSCKHPFHSAAPEGTVPPPERIAAELGIELVRPDVTDTMLAMLKDPPHGYGKHLNPCIDCRIMYLKEGAKLMAERGAKFLFTGEVLGQRPMSQRRDALDIIDRDSGLRGLVLRPLSARLLRPTIAEEKGWVDRARLMNISGRSRARQLALANELKITGFSAPAGGCLLTMEDFARKVQDVLRHTDVPARDDIEVLKTGRHFRLSDSAILVMGKDDRENTMIERRARPDDLIIVPMDVPGPLGLVRGPAADEQLQLACAIIGRYIKRAAGPVGYSIAAAGESRGSIETTALAPDEVESYRI